jgi:single-strand DNA-binding protein
VYIEGRLKTRKWQDDSGNDRYSTEIQCTDFTFLTPKNETGQAGSGQAASNTSQAQSQSISQAPESLGDENDDLPF